MEVGEELTIQIQGLGHIPSFKNRKRAAKGRLFTEPKIKERMQQIIRAIEFHLSSLYRTSEAATQTDKSLRSWIASSVPYDDSGDWIPESDGYRIRKVSKGDEGVIIRIMRVE